jgi:acyl-coenzyme A synthetase/AMP-(fatty) acid ligase
VVLGVCPGLCIERDHESIVTEIVGWCLELPLNRSSVFYVGRPLFYTGGLVLALSSLFVGATVIANDYEEDDDTAEVWDDYQRELSERDVEWAFFVPDQIRSFSKVEPKPKRHSTFVLVMGAPISGAEKRAARDALGSQVVESWGNSESLGTITEPEDLDQRPDSVGRPFLTDELQVVDETLRECPPGEIGRIAGAETAGFQKYSNRPDATKEVKRNALIISDDIGRCDEDGYFYVAGRDQDVVLRGKTSLVLPRIADKVRTCDGIAGVEVCASDGEGDLEIAAAVVLAPGRSSTGDELCDELNAALDIEEHLSRVVVVEALPRLASGKVNRLAVHARLFEELK